MNNPLPPNHSKNKRITITVPEYVDFKFRRIASQKFKFEQGWYSKAVTEAMEAWIKNNELTMLNHGTCKISRFMGSKMWTLFKNYEKDIRDPDYNAINHVFDYFENSPYITESKYNISNDNFTFNVKSSTLSDQFSVEQLMGKHLFPLSIISRAYAEDVTGNDYHVEECKIGKKSKIKLTKRSQD